MAPFALIIMGALVYILNQRPDVHIGFRGLPWLDVPCTLVILGGISGLVSIEVRRRRKDREARRKRGEF